MKSGSLKTVSLWIKQIDPESSHKLVILEEIQRLKAEVNYFHTVLGNVGYSNTETIYRRWK